MTWNMLSNAVMNDTGVTVIGNIFASFSTIQTSYLLLWGDLVVGESCMEGFKDRFNLVQD